MSTVDDIFDDLQASRLELQVDRRAPAAKGQGLNAFGHLIMVALGNAIPEADAIDVEVLEHKVRRKDEPR